MKNYFVVALIVIVALTIFLNTILDRFSRLIRMRFSTSTISLGMLGPAVSWNVIKHVYVINVKKRVDRMEYVAKQLSHLKIKYERYEAVDSSLFKAYYEAPSASNISAVNISSVFDPRLRLDPRCFGPNPRYGMLALFIQIKLSKLRFFSPPTPPSPQVCKNHYRTHSPANTGCTLSHMQLWLQIIDHVSNAGPLSDGPVLILEDDVMIDKRSRSILPKLIKNLDELDPNWIILGVGYCANHIPSVAIPFVLDKDMGFSCLHAYVLRNSTSAQLLFDELNTPYVQVIDIPWWKLVQRGFYTSYVYAPNDLFRQDKHVAVVV